MADNPNDQTSTLSDVQRALVLLLIGTLALTTNGLVFRVVFSAPIDDVVDLSKIMLAALVNMGLVGLGYYFGNKDKADATQAKLMDKMTPPAPVTPPAAVTPVPPWWARLNDDEKNAITAAGTTDPRVGAFITASQNGAATADDLAYLVSKSLLTQERADLIKAT